MTTQVNGKAPNELGDGIADKTTSLRGDRTWAVHSIFPTTASYVIYISGATINAVNGMTGNIDYSGTDFYTVLQNVINVLPSYIAIDANGFTAVGGGLIHLKSGQYTLVNHGLTLNGGNNPNLQKKFIFEGEGASTVIYNTSTEDAISMYANSSIIKDMQIIGNTPNSGNGISIYSSVAGTGGSFRNELSNLTLYQNNIGIKNHYLKIVIFVLAEVMAFK